MKKNIILILIFLVFYTSFSTTNKTKTIIVGINDDPPMVFLKDNQASGYFHDVFTKILQDTEYKLEYKYGTWTQMVEWLKLGEIDMVYSIAPTEERKDIFSFNSETIFLSWGVLYGNKNVQISNLYDLKNLRIAGVKDDIYYDGGSNSIKHILAALNIYPKFIETNSYKQSVQKVLSGEADICAIPREFMEYQDNIRNKLIQTPIIFHPTSLNIAFKKNSEYAKELIPYIDNILAKEKEDLNSFYYQILNKYSANRIIFKDNIIIKKVINYKVISIIIFPLILILIILHNFILRKKIRLITCNLLKANEELKDNSIKDYLTGLYNRRYFEENFISEISKANRHSRSLSFIIMDIDFFKKINDSYGHQIGDYVIQKVASILKEQTRKSDIVCRYGGEEFSILLPDSDLNQAFIAAEKLRKIIENTDFEYVKEKVSITAGVSELTEEINNMDKIVSIGDKALYQGKKNGRNQVMLYNSAKNN